METKTYIWFGIFIGSIIGGWIGGMFDHGNFLGLWGILLSGVGAIIGVFIGYKLGEG
ncbi:MAG TPA: hypothetical protein VLE69_02475 [Candidatus Saccharimonadales bacterium]|nr:hypothetical protein [Candidatus Saccharimonadales bacterium]